MKNKRKTQQGIWPDVDPEALADPNLFISKTWNDLKDKKASLPSPAGDAKARRKSWRNSHGH